ncbi:hypothetical protein PARHAE_00715 [Paracoccus haematequi]|uniref:DUF1364 domain-containing protein n=2 Tax=Paracoccus haematequi TaxID=2491866 RepID=A0A3S4EQG9_9RHOB|nr:hypothetical protein PARHAE_00715 [Paracoccus haematequi]
MNARFGDLAGRGALGLKGTQPKPQKRMTGNLVHVAARQNARGRECTLRLPSCNGDPQTTVLAHLRMFGAAGMGQKPDDWFAVFACSACHDSLDRRDAATAGEWGHEDALRALYLTLKQQFRDGIYVPGS